MRPGGDFQFNVAIRTVTIDRSAGMAENITVNVVPRNYSRTSNTNPFFIIEYFMSFALLNYPL
jgi:hypothetical protein